MARNNRYRIREASSRPRLEGLEKRWVLSSVIATSPAADAVLDSSPTSYQITFDSPIDSFSLGFADVIVEQVADDGSVSSAYPDSDLPYENLDETGTLLTLDTFSTLSPGHYRLVLSGMGSLMGLDGSSVANLDGSDQTLADFTIARKGVGLSDAIDLGAVGPDGLTVPGNLDFTANANAVQLYKFTVPAGHFWRLGAAVSAQADGSPLNAALTLFDSDGRPLATDDLGLDSAPADPYLFRGLSAGVYYIGVSGTGDLPGLPGAYDPVSQTPGPAQTQAGGDYTLHLVADTADLPGALTNFKVDYADSQDSTPTGFTMQFSTALDLGTTGSDVFNRSTTGIQVVDQKGKSWPVAAVNYDADHAAIAFLFQDRLPKGVYTIRMSSTQPLRDLAGLVPTSPTMPKGVLATLRVLPDNRGHQPDGTLSIPDAALRQGKVVIDQQGNSHTFPTVTKSEDIGSLTPNVVLSGISRSMTLQPGQTVAYRVVNLVDDYYKLAVDHSDAALGITVDGGSTLIKLDPGPANQENSVLAQLGLGARIIRFTAAGDKPVSFSLTLSIGSFRWDSLLANGLGQGPALNLRLVSTDTAPSFQSTGSSSTTSSTTDAVGSSPTGPFAGPLAPPTGGAITTITAIGVTLAPTPGVLPPSTAQAASALPFEVGGVLVGRPSIDNERIATIGPGEGKELALASIGLGQSIEALGILRGAFSAPGQVDLKPGEGAEPNELAQPIVDGSMEPEITAEMPAEKLNEAQPAQAPSIASMTIPGSFELTPEGTVEVVDNGSQPVSPVDLSEGVESKQSNAKTAWIVGMVGVSALSARWIHQRRRRAQLAASPASRLEKAVGNIPAPHSRASVRNAKSMA